MIQETNSRNDVGFNRVLTFWQSGKKRWIMVNIHGDLTLTTVNKC